jgi:hypothetical protein
MVGFGVSGQRLQKFYHFDQLILQVGQRRWVFVAVINAARFQGLNYPLGGFLGVAADGFKRRVNIAGYSPVNPTVFDRKIADDKRGNEISAGRVS